MHLFPLRNRTLLSGFSFLPYHYLLCWRLVPVHVAIETREMNPSSFNPHASYPFPILVTRQRLRFQLLTRHAVRVGGQCIGMDRVCRDENRIRLGCATHPVVINCILSPHWSLVSFSIATPFFQLPNLRFRLTFSINLLYHSSDI